MHEMSLAEGVLQLVEDSAKQNGFAQVKTVWLEIGQLAGVEPEAMRFCFDAIAQNTLLQGARLEIIETQGRGWCLSCSQTVPIQLRYDPCPLCGDYQVQPTEGLDMRVKELEVE